MARNDGNQNGAGCVDNCGHRGHGDGGGNEPPISTGGSNSATSLSSSSISVVGGESSASNTTTLNNNAASATQPAVSYSTIGVRGEWRQVAAAIAPPLATGDCLGSASGGFNNGIFGLSGGKTYVDEGCNARYDSMLLRQYGLEAESILRLCQVPAMAESLGERCPEKYHVQVDESAEGRWWTE